VVTGADMGLTLFSILINYLDNGAERALSKFAGDTKLGVVVDTPAVVLQLRGMWRDWRNGLTTAEVEEGKVQSPAPGEEQPHAPLQGWGLTVCKAAFQ